MKVDLNEEQQKLLETIKANLNIARRWSEVTKEERIEAFKNMATAAHSLHISLNPRPKHHAYMIENRELPPEHPSFYEHIHPVEDLLKYLEDVHANDDPVDQTIGERFDFTVFSRRRGHNDLYSLERTKTGWRVSFITIGGECDKAGRPFLFDNLKHDSINYPADLGGYLEWLWEQAKVKGLTHGQVQEALDELSSWVITCEKESPVGPTWEDY